MKASQLFNRTSKNANKNALVLSNELLEKAGYIVKLSKGIYIYTPLMWRVVQKFLNIIKEELNSIGGQELVLPLLHPSDLWEQTGRWNAFSSEGLLYTLKDRENKDLCLAPTHEEVISFFVAQWMSSKKQLPLHLYQIATKFRDEIRPRFGLMRTKELLMQDSYTFSSSEQQMDEQYQKLRQAYSNIFNRLGLKYVVVEADGGKIGKGRSEEFQVLCSIGEDTICVSDSYGANIEAAVSIVPPYSYDKLMLPIEEIETINITTIDKLSTFFSKPQQLILKTLILKLSYPNKTQFVAIGIRGDRQINLVKIASHFNAENIELASDEEILQQFGIEKGFIGPLNCPIPFYADLTTQPMMNFICAGNQKDKHFINVNWERDVPKPEFYDFLLTEAGDECPSNPSTPYSVHQGIEVAHIFNLGTRYTESFNVSFQDETDNQNICWMGTYGIGIGRTLASCVEQLSDNQGIIWPQVIAPFAITIICAALEDTSLLSLTNSLYQQLQEKGFDPLLDDRNERLGFKLKDSDFIGIPYKLIVGKSFQTSGNLEIESRDRVKHLVKPEDFPNWCEKNLIKNNFNKQLSLSLN